MSEERKIGKIEEKIASVDSWIKSLSEGSLEDISPVVLKEVLERFGANFEVGEEILAGLAEYTNKTKADNLRLVWGERFKEFKSWTEEWADFYEAGGKTLPRLGKKPKEGEPDTRTRTSGMKQFFGELTAFAAGQMSFDDYKKYTEARVLNGKLWQEGKKDERVEINIPTSKEPIRPSSIPPDFPIAAWEKIKSWAK